LAKSKLIGNESLIIAFHSSRSPLQQSYDGLSVIKERKYGDTAISIYHKETKS
jgi:16S rRNA G966 N2-methylase RsmD